MTETLPFLIILFYLVLVGVACVTAYAVLRFAIFHGLRAHTRWVDNGKDSKPSGWFA